MTLVTLTTISVAATAQINFGNAINKLKLEVRADGEYTTTDTTPNLS